MSTKKIRIRGNTDTSLTELGRPADAKITGDKLAELVSAIDDINYRPIQIEQISNNQGVVQLGTTLTEITISWVLSKNAKTLTLDGLSLDKLTSGSHTIIGLSMNTAREFCLHVTDERDTSARKVTKVEFFNGIYYGAAAISELSSAFIQSLTKSLQSNKVKTFSVNSSTNQYIWYALPTRYGTPIFKVGGFTGGFSEIGKIQFKNSSNYTEEYSIWRSDNKNLGNQTIEVL